MLRARIGAGIGKPSAWTIRSTYHPEQPEYEGYCPPFRAKRVMVGNIPSIQAARGDKLLIDFQLSSTNQDTGSCYCSLLLDQSISRILLWLSTFTRFRL
jgi:hypothetical protein